MEELLSINGLNNLGIKHKIFIHTGLNFDSFTEINFYFKTFQNILKMQNDTIEILFYSTGNNGFNRNRNLSLVDVLHVPIFSNVPDNSQRILAFS